MKQPLLERWNARTLEGRIRRGVLHTPVRASQLSSVLALLLLLFSVPGCAFTLLKNAMDKNENLSPEQIEAYSKIGLDVYACFEVGGPPPMGNVVFMLWPKTKELKASFGPNCQIVRAQEGQTIFMPGSITPNRGTPAYQQGGVVYFVPQGR